MKQLAAIAFAVAATAATPAAAVTLESWVRMIAFTGEKCSAIHGNTAACISQNRKYMTVAVRDGVAEGCRRATIDGFVFATARRQSNSSENLLICDYRAER